MRDAASTDLSRVDMWLYTFVAEVSIVSVNKCMLQISIESLWSSISAYTSSPIGESGVGNRLCGKDLTSSLIDSTPSIARLNQEVM